MQLSWEQFQSWLDPLICDNKHSIEIKSAPLGHQISTNTRTICKGDFFIPLVGKNFDGHHFIDEALSKGASGFVYEPTKKHLFSSNVVKKGLAVKSTLTALQKISQGWLEFCQPVTTLALTGSVGKTTVKEVLFSILKDCDKVIATKDSFNNEIGVPLTLLRTKPETKYLLLEFGARHSGDIAFLTQLARPKVCLVTNVKKVHLSEFGSYEAILKTKTEIYRDSPKSAICVVPMDDQNILAEALRLNKVHMGFGEHPDALVRIISSQWLTNGSMRVTLECDKEPLEIKLPFGHESLPINVAAAVCCAIALSIPKDKIVAGLSNYQPARSRFNVLRLKNFILIDDSYNASPASMLSGFNSCRKMFSSQAKLVVLGNMEELGDESSKEHLKIGSECANILEPSLLVTIGDKAKDIGKGAIDAGLDSSKYLHFETTQDLIAHSDRLSLDHHVVFVKGSNSVGLQNFVNHISSHG